MNRLILRAGDRFFVALAHLPRLDPLEQQFQAPPVHFAAGDIGPVADKPTLLEALSPHAQAAAVEVQDADLGRSSVDEREQVPDSGSWCMTCLANA